MKNLYPKNKAAILALASVLSPEDREVLAYMITRSMKTTNPPSMVEEKKKCKKPNNGGSIVHKPPMFDCGCFDCYTSYWFRWDSSPNRELIHQAIEAFEEHLTNGENSKKSGRNKKKDKMARRLVIEKPEAETMAPEKEPEVPESVLAELETSCLVPENDAFPTVLLDKSEDVEKKDDYEEGDVVEYATENLQVMEEAAVQIPASNHRGLARKVLPDVLGLFNSRLWGLWSPNV
uniref:Uncharacterized protein n=1 Tax=Nelumbo nucifera TaxID=4432 RepID=A0A822YQ19_NELNU|nr:TPA_asm: hypothetical protein HUJ06_004833 [Nelumbo nucifera]